MNKTLRLSFSLRNAYRVNAILYAIKQIPLLRRALPDSLYACRGLKVLGQVLAILWEVVSVFAGKFLYFLTMVVGIGFLYEQAPADRAFLHILVLLTFIGAFLNTYLFNPTRDKYYAVVLLRMDAREYALVNYFYDLLKVLVGFLPFTLLFGLLRGVPVWLCVLAPFFVAGCKAVVAAVSLWDYARRRKTPNENKLSRIGWAIGGFLLLAAYVPPALGWTLPLPVAAGLFLLGILAGVPSLLYIARFPYYRQMMQEMLSQSMQQMDAAKTATRRASSKAITADVRITSRRKGFAYLNELFVKRHRKILWQSAQRIAAVCLALLALSLLALFLYPAAKAPINEILLSFLPYFVFILYAINRGMGFTQALFMNCDRSLLTYSFYKQPGMVLRLFAIRLRGIIAVNLLPAAVIGFGLALLLYVTGGTDNPLNYGILIVSILCMSVFFSVHYLTVYYLLQPYNAGTEIKSGTYRIVMMVTYLICFFLMQLRMSIPLFGAMCIAFCVLYCLIACLLVYKFAPRTFRLRA
ncbi:MAG: hypothetical protein ACOX83_01875 [Candidatus Spyradocola sp.]|jgi:hypothetical protein